jgi:hypothetical protein
VAAVGSGLGRGAGRTGPASYTTSEMAPAAGQKVLFFFPKKVNVLQNRLTSFQVFLVSLWILVFGEDASAIPGMVGHWCVRARGLVGGRLLPLAVRSVGWRARAAPAPTGWSLHVAARAQYLQKLHNAHGDVAPGVRGWWRWWWWWWVCVGGGWSRSQPLTGHRGLLLNRGFVARC